MQKIFIIPANHKYCFFNCLLKSIMEGLYMQGTFGFLETIRFWAALIGYDSGVSVNDFLQA